MGTLYTRFLETKPLDMLLSRKRKRVASGQQQHGHQSDGAGTDDDDSADGDRAEDELLRLPKRKKLMCTTDYIYKALFVEQRNSDISVHALNKVWHLHKIYLCQSPYFASLFSGSWRESATDRYANIEILDPQITLDGLNTVFGSLYNNEVIIDPRQVGSVLATATLFQLDGLIERCAEVMIETIMPETVIGYYDNASAYGLRAVQEAAIKWLLVNLLHYYHRHHRWLRSISIPLMQQLVQHADLYLIQTEFSLYMLLRHWLHLQLRTTTTTTRPTSQQPSSTSEATTNNSDSSSLSSTTAADTGGDSFSPLSDASAKFFAEHAPDKGAALLQLELGRPYEPVFRSLRYQHMLNHPIDLHLLLRDNVVPKAWLQRPLFEQWNSMLYIDQALDQGPLECDRDTFLRICNRCGRFLLTESMINKWRWTGFSFGIDLLLLIDRRVLSIKRNQRTDHERLLSLQLKRNIIIRVTLSSLNAQRQVVHSQSTDVMALRLERNQEVKLLTFDALVTYPLMVSVNLLFTTPNKSPAIEEIDLPGEADDAHPSLNILNIGSATITAPPAAAASIENNNSA